MMDFLNSSLQQLNLYSKSNPVLAGVVSLWGISVVTWVFRSIPEKLFTFCKTQITTTLTFSNSDSGSNRQTFIGFQNWLGASKWMKWSRAMYIDSLSTYDTGTEKISTTIGIGIGTHFFTFKGWPYWVKREQDTSVHGSHTAQYKLTITTIGRNRDRLIQLVKQFEYKRTSGKPDVYVYKSNQWSRMTSIAERKLSSVIVGGGIKEKIVFDIEKFQSSRAWYIDRGLPYKRIIALHGKPGTGKTSLVKAIASHFEMNICLLNLADMSDELLLSAITTIPFKSLIIIEDFDNTDAAKIRKGMELKQVRTQKPPVVDTDSKSSSNKLDLNMLTLSGILNAFDGVVSLDDKIIFMTTNVLNQIDPALLRAGRTDAIYEIPLLSHVDILEYIRVMYPSEQVDLSSIQFPDTAGCELHRFYIENFDNLEMFIAELSRFHQLNTNEVKRLHVV